jgi:hypothetical protein
MRKSAAMLYLVLVLPIPVWSQPNFTRNGSAEIISENCYKITSHKSANDAGSIWCEYPTQLNHSFDIRFAVNLGCTDYAGEGLAFVMHSSKEKYDALGCADACLGIGNSIDCPTAITPSLAVEFDTRYTKGHADLYVPHISLIKDGNFLSPLVKPVRMKSAGKDFRDCEYHSVKISWRPSKQLLEVYFENELRIAYKGDLNTFFGKEKNIYIGFTGASGPQANMQMICVQSIDIQVDEEFDQKKMFEDGVGIFPNPIRERLTVDVHFPYDQKILVQLFDASGKLIHEIPRHKVKDNKYFFNMPGLPSGIYYVSVTNGINQVSKRIVHLASARA